jgi:hypothetical protein
MANNCSMDPARHEMVTTDVGPDRLLVHRLPGLEADRILTHGQFSQPRGVCIGHTGGRSLMFVTDEGRGRIFVLDSETGAPVADFPYGLTQAEGIACDDDQQRVYVCDDNTTDHGCKAFTYDGQQVGPEFGVAETGSDAEGVALYRCGVDDGFIIVSDQKNNEFEVFERQPPFTHLCTFELRAESDLTNATDGIDVFQDTAFPDGLFGACDNCHGPGDELDLVAWEDIAVACPLDVCPLGEPPGAGTSSTTSTSTTTTTSSASSTNAHPLPPAAYPG